MRWASQEVLLGLHVRSADPDGPSPYAGVSTGELLGRAFRSCSGERWPHGVGDGADGVAVLAQDVLAARGDCVYGHREWRLYDVLRAAESTDAEDEAWEVAMRLAAGSSKALQGWAEAPDPWGAPPDEREAHAARARRVLIESYIGYVLRLARRYVGRGVPFLDLVQEGVTGIAEAVDRYEPRGRPFKQVATTWAWQRIEKCLATYGRTIRLPLNVHQRLQKVERACEDSVRSGVVSPRLEDVWAAGPLGAGGRALRERDWAPSGTPAPRLALEHGPELGRIAALLGFREPALEVRVWAPETDWDDGAADLSGERIGEAGPDRTDGHDTAAVIARGLASLRDRDARIVRAYFGLGEAARTLEEIGTEIGLTRERVRQIKEKALDRLRRHDWSDLVDLDAPGWASVQPVPPPPSPIWQRRWMKTAVERRVALHRLLSAHVDEYRGYRRNKSRLRDVSIGLLREAGLPLLVGDLVQSLNARLRHDEFERHGTVDEEYLLAVFRERPATFLVTRGTVGLVAVETGRSEGSPMPLCPPLGIGGVDGAFLRSVFAVGRVPSWDTGALPSEERREADVLTYVLGLSVRHGGSGQARLPVIPPQVRGEAAWRSGLDAASARLGGMGRFWATLVHLAPASGADLAAAFAQAYPLGAVDTADRLDLLGALGAVRVDAAGRFWLTPRGGVCADAWAQYGDAAGLPAAGPPAAGMDDPAPPQDEVRLDGDAAARLNDTLLGL